MSHSVLIVDDHRIFREGVRNLLHQSNEFEVVGEAAKADQAVALATELQPDVVVLDLMLEDSDGLSAITPIRSHSPHSKIVVLSMNDDGAVVSHALKLGVQGFVLKRASWDDLRLGLKTVVAGGIYLSPEVPKNLLTRKHSLSSRRRSQLPGLDDLSPREFEVLELLALGKSTKDVADMLNLHVDTVRTHRKRIMRKVGANHSSVLMDMARQAGMARGPAKG